MRLQGYSVPRTSTGRASLVPPPPWHYVGDFLVVDYWADPDAVRAVLPEGLDPHPDPGRCAAVCADWQSCSEGGDELDRPDKVPLPRVFYRGQCASGRRRGHDLPVHLGGPGLRVGAGLDPGFPQETRLHLDDPHLRRGGPADPGLRPGGRHGATCSARGRAIADMTVTIEGESEEGPRHNAPPIINVRHFPRLAAGRHDDPQVHELVRAVSRDRIGSKVVAGPATLTLHPAPVRSTTRSRP